MRRRAAGLETYDIALRKNYASRAESTADSAYVISSDLRQCLRPSIRGHRSAAVMVTAITRSQHNLIARRRCWFVARVNRLPQAAGMRCRSGDRQRYRSEVPHEREEQQKLGDPSMHAQPLEAYQVTDAESNELSNKYSKPPC